MISKKHSLSHWLDWPEPTVYLAVIAFGLALDLIPDLLQFFDLGPLLARQGDHFVDRHPLTFSFLKEPKDLGASGEALLHFMLQMPLVRECLNRLS